MTKDERQSFIKELSDFLMTDGYQALSKKQEKAAKEKRPACVELQMRKGEDDYYFSVMILSKNLSERYYDYISLPEWIFAFLHNEGNQHFQFAIVCRDLDEKDPERYNLLDPSVMFEKISIPPFKTSFSLTLDEIKSLKSKTNINEQRKMQNSKTEIIAAIKGKKKKAQVSSSSQIKELIKNYYSNIKI